MEKENLSAADLIINSLLQYNDHMYHNRPGFVVPATNTINLQWHPCTHVQEGNDKVIYRLDKVGKKSTRTKIGVLRDNGDIFNANRKVGQYRKAGIFPEVAAWMYSKVAEVWKLDNEFAAKWASYAWKQEHRDLKVILAAFMLVQNRAGDPVKENGETVFKDQDYRAVGEAMLLNTMKDRDFNPRMVLRVFDILNLSEIAKINRELGFGASPKNPFTGRLPKTIQKYLFFRETNPRMLQGLVKAGFRTSVMELSRRSGFKPADGEFFQALRWKQKQSSDGRRSLAIGKAVKKAETWDKFTEEQICKRIIDTKPAFKVIASMVPSKIGITPAIAAAAIESGSLSDKELIINTPTLEALGLFKFPEIKTRWETALKSAEDMRSLNIAKNVRTAEVKNALSDSADTVLKKAVEEKIRNLRIYFIVDISGSMEGAIESAKDCIAKTLQAFPLNKVHVSVFNTYGKEIKLQHASKAGVDNAFKGIHASGGTDYGAGVNILAGHKPGADEETLFVFVGDEGASDFHGAVQRSGLNPAAFALIKIVSPSYPEKRFAVQNTAKSLGIPCFMIDVNAFADPYAIPRTLSNLIASTPVHKTELKVNRVSLAEEIMKTELLQKPAWA